MTPNLNIDEYNNKSSQKRIRIQRSVSKYMLLYISKLKVKFKDFFYFRELNSLISKAGFVVSWTPYAFVSFYTGFIDEKAISPLGATLPACFMKSSMVWSSLFFVCTNRNIRKKLKGDNFSVGHNLLTQQSN